MQTSPDLFYKLSGIEETDCYQILAKPQYQKDFTDAHEVQFFLEKQICQKTDHVPGESLLLSFGNICEGSSGKFFFP